MICRNCGNQMDPQAVVCVKCGVPAGQGQNFCPNCGAATTPGAAVCTQCGVALAQCTISPIAGRPDRSSSFC